MIGCTCTELQLAYVGCDCHAWSVSYWPKGYADEAGPKTVLMAHGADFAAEVVKLAGYTAKIFSAHDAEPRANPTTFSRDYIRQMSVGG